MKRKTLVINFITVLAILLVAEGISRFMLSRIYNRSFDAGLIVDNKYGSSPGLKANASGNVWGKRMFTDSEGGRRCTNYPLTPLKWLYIGDSVTEGVGVEDSSTFVNLVSLARDSFSYLNMSLIGYSTADYVNVLAHMVPADENITGITLAYCLNDVYGGKRSSELPVMAKQNLIGRLNGFMQQHYATYKIVKLLVYQHSDSYFRYDAQFYQSGNGYFMCAMADIKTCDSICRANNRRFDIVLLPYRSQLKAGDDAGRLKPQQLVKQFCAANGIICRDAAPYLTLKNNPGRLYLFADEIHFSEEGHRAVAEFLLQ